MEYIQIQETIIIYSKPIPIFADEDGKALKVEEKEQAENE